MKHRITLSLVTGLCLIFCGHSAAAQEGEDTMGPVSYILGYQMGRDLEKSGESYQEEALLEGIKTGFTGQTSKYSEEEMRKFMMEYRVAFQNRHKERMATKATDNLAEGQAYRDENGKREGVVTLPSGLQYEIITPGEGAKPTLNDKVKTHYAGTLTDGTPFDSSHQRGQPAEFPVSGVIPGWQEALPLMKVGAKWKLVVPPDQAYGDKGAGPLIGPNATLVFEIELLEILGS